MRRRRSTPHSFAASAMPAPPTSAAAYCRGAGITFSRRHAPFLDIHIISKGDAHRLIFRLLYLFSHDGRRDDDGAHTPPHAGRMPARRRLICAPRRHEYAISTPRVPRKYREMAHVGIDTIYAAGRRLLLAPILRQPGLRARGACSKIVMASAFITASEHAGDYFDAAGSAISRRHLCFQPHIRWSMRATSRRTTSRRTEHFACGRRSAVYASESLLFSLPRRREGEARAQRRYFSAALGDWWRFYPLALRRATMISRRRRGAGFAVIAALAAMHCVIQASTLSPTRRRYRHGFRGG